MNLHRLRLLAIGDTMHVAPVQFPGIGRLRKNGAGYIFDPAPWQLF